MIKHAKQSKARQENIQKQPNEENEGASKNHKG